MFRNKQTKMKVEIKYVLWNNFSIRNYCFIQFIIQHFILKNK